MFDCDCKSSPLSSSLQKLFDESPKAFDQLLYHSRTDRRALEKHPMPWPQVFSPDGTVEKQFGVEVYPTKIVVGQDGVVLKVFQGESAEFYSYLESVLSSL